jgi:hypothetical protein
MRCAGVFAIAAVHGSPAGHHTGLFLSSTLFDSFSGYLSSDDVADGRLDALPLIFASSSAKVRP